jgi:hypothetical protein
MPAAKRVIGFRNLPGAARGQDANAPPAAQKHHSTGVSRIFGKLEHGGLVGLVKESERCPQGKVGSGRHPQGLLLELVRIVHVQVAVRFQPVFMHLGREDAAQP